MENCWGQTPDTQQDHPVASWYHFHLVLPNACTQGTLICLIRKVEHVHDSTAFLSSDDCLVTY